MEKLDPRQLFENLIRTGEIKIPKPYPGYSGRTDLKYDVVFSDFTEYFDAPRVEDLDANMQKYLLVAKEGVQGFNEHIGTMLGTPEIEFQIPGQNTGLTTPKLDSFNLDKRVIVKLLRAKGIKFDYSGIVSFDAAVVPFNVSYRHDIKLRSKRVYETEPQGKIISGINVYRYPVILNTNNGVGDSIHKFADLTFYTLINQLEPHTTSHLHERLRTFGKKIGQEDLDMMVNAVLVEETATAKLLVSGWLKAKDISEHSIKSWYHSIIPEVNVEVLLKYAKLRDHEKVLKGYCRPDIALDELLH